MRRAVVFVALAFLGCTKPAPAPTGVVSGDQPYPDDDPAAVARGDACARAGRVLWNCHCPEVAHYEGKTFPEFCRSRWPGIDAECIATHACADLGACSVRCGR